MLGLHRLAALLADLRVKLGTVELHNRFAALLADLGVEFAASFLGDSLAALLADLGVVARAVFPLDRFATLFSGFPHGHVATLIHEIHPLMVMPCAETRIKVGSWLGFSSCPAKAMVAYRILSLPVPTVYVNFAFHIDRRGCRC